MTANRHSWSNIAPYVVPAGLLLIALTPMPYGYYAIMRWVLCAAFAHLAVQSHEGGRGNWTCVWVAAAGIYNPIFKVTATRDVWTVVNLITIALVAYGAWRGRLRNDAESIEPPGG